MFIPKSCEKEVIYHRSPTQSEIKFGQREYLDDEPEFHEGIYVFHMYIVDGI